ncbi:zinc finger domain-containing protein [Nocardia sp. NPDC003963]
MSEVDNVVTLDAFRDRRTARLALSVSCPWCGQPPGQRCLLLDIDDDPVGYLPEEFVAHWLRRQAARGGPNA